MKKTYIGFAGLSLLLLLGTQTVQAQQGFGTDKPAKSAAVDIQSSKRGLLIPRVNLKSIKDVETIDKPAQSLMVYNQAKTTGTDLVTPGYYYWDTDHWVRFAQQGDITAINLGGDVSGPTSATVVGAIQGVPVDAKNPTANQVLTFVPGTGTEKGKWVPTSITPDVITDAKGITGTGITVEGGANSTLKDVKLAIEPGGANQVMVTSGDGKTTTWVDQNDIVTKNTTNVLTSSENVMTSNVNSVSGSAIIVNSLETSLDSDNKLVTKVNGVSASPLDLTSAVQKGQLKTTVSAKDEKVTVTSTVDQESKTTNYVVGVDEEKLNLGNMGGQVTTIQITDGAVTTEKIKAGKDGQVLITKDGISTWVDQSDIVPTTTNTLTKKTTGEGSEIKIDSNTIVSTVNGKEAEVKVIDNVTNTVNGTTIVTSVNGVDSGSVDLTPAIQAGQKTVEVINGTNTTVTKTPAAGDAKHTTYAVNVSNDAIQAAQKITTVSQGNGVKVTPTTVTGSNTTDYEVAINTDSGNEGDVLTVVKDGETNTKVEWKKPEEHKNIYTHDGTLTENRTVDLDGKSLSFINEVDENDSKVAIIQKGRDFDLQVISKERPVLRLASTGDNSSSKLFIFQDPNNVGQISSTGKYSGIQFNSNNDEGGGNDGFGFSINRRVRVKLDNNNTFTVGLLTLNNQDEPLLNEKKPDVENFNSFNVKYGHVKIEEINELKGAAADKIVVADADGVLKTVASTMPKVFYMPPILFDTSVVGDKPVLDLHAEYVKQFKVSDNKLRSVNSPIDIPTLGAKELYYYITHYDSDVLEIKGITEDGKLTYSVKNNATPATFMTIVFVVK